MRMLKLALPVALCAISSPAFAVSDSEIVPCRDYALNAADVWSANDIARAGNLAKRPPGAVVAIVAGRKYFVPAHVQDDDSGTIPAVGQRALWRAQVYREELRRCLGARTLTINYGQQ